ncbi:MAG TPA: TolC family protein [Candidatus Omnitrophota bacterium]|nr:TolC family protein [Candidatus Omnitrophota bacterium]HRY85358.1 TolC family protein [Candidatus Omnitrophota bacterium]
MTMMIKKMAALFLVFCLLPGPAAFAEGPSVKAGVPVMTFLDCYRKVLAHYPGLRKRYEQLEQAKAQRNLAIADLFPKVRGVFGMETSDDPVFVFGSLLRQKSFTEQNFELNSLNTPRHRTNYHFGIEGDMLLFDSFNTISKIRSARRLVKSADLQADFTEMEAGILTLESYLGILLARELYNIAVEVKNASDKDLQQAKDLNEKGMILGADYYAAKVTAAGIEREVNRLQGLLKSSRMLMNILMGEDPELVWDAVGSFPDTVQEKGALQEWLAQAYQKRSDLAAIGQMLDAQRIESLRQKTSFLPKFYGFGSLDENSHDWHTGGQSFSLGVKGTMDFFDPSYPGRVKGANAQYRELKAERDALRDEIVKGLIQEMTRYETVAADTPVMKSAYADAKQASELTAKLYQEGRKSIADLLEMRRGYFETAAGFQSLLLALELEYAKLLFLSGQLNEDGLHQVNQRLQA